MIKIGIELNGVIRNINKQFLFYYCRDINPELDEESVDTNAVSILDKLHFENDDLKQQFIYEDYPYEIFGCSQSMSRNLHTYLNGWIYNLKTRHNIKDISYFSLDESELSIQSTYFYLSKSGSRIREVFFPYDVNDLWGKYDVIITMNPNIVLSKPINKICILIHKNDNEYVQKMCDYTYNDLEEVINDTNFLDKLYNNKKINSMLPLIYRIKNKIQKVFKKWKK